MVTDYLDDANDDLLIANGDFVKGESTLQHKKRLFKTVSGDWRQYPKIGIGAFQFLLDDELGSLYTKIQEQYKLDGVKVSGLKVSSDGQVTDESYYP